MTVTKRFHMKILINKFLNFIICLKNLSCFSSRDEITIIIGKFDHRKGSEKAEMIGKKRKRQKQRGKKADFRLKAELSHACV